jgi:uncharacterized protein
MGEQAMSDDVTTTGAGLARDFPRPTVSGVEVERDVPITAEDGTILRVDIYHPTDWRETRYPALFAVSGYQKSLVGLPTCPVFPFVETGPIEWYVQRGYVYVLADARGTGTSEGRWEMLSREEQRDLYDVIEWIAAQQWSNEKVGMIGQSYFGLVQWLAAAQQPPHLTCIAPYDAWVDPYRDCLYHGGIACNFGSVWDRVLKANHVWGPDRDRPLRFGLGVADTMLEHPFEDEFWRERSSYEQLPDITIPVLSVGNWGKNSVHVRGNILGYERVGGVKRLRMEGGALHPALNIAKSLMDFESEELHEALFAPWYDHWLRDVDNGVLDGPPVSLYVSGVGENRHYAEWPPAQAVDTSFYLGGNESEARFSLNDGTLATQIDPASDDAGGALASTSYDYPNALWHVGTATITSLGVPNPVANILTFATSELDEDLEVVGRPRLELYASSDQLDTDFFVRVADESPRPPELHPELPSPALFVSKGWLRASHRALDQERTTAYRPFHDHTAPSPLEPGTIYRFDIELTPMAHVFRAGHQIRVDLANGDTPLLEAVFDHYYTPKVGTDTIHHNSTYPSRLVLPGLPSGTSGDDT